MKIKVATAAAVGALVAAASIISSRSMRSETKVDFPQPERPLASQPVSTSGGRPASEGTPSRAPSRDSMLLSSLLLTTALICSVTAVFFLNRNVFAEGACVLAALCLSLFGVRGPRRRTNLAVFVTCLIVAYVDGLLIGDDALRLIDNFDALDLFYIAAISFAGLVAVTATAVTWVSRWKYTEPVALGAISVALALVCMPGLYLLMKPATYPTVEGVGYIFDSGSSTSTLSMSVFTAVANPDVPSEQYSYAYGNRTENFSLNNPGKGTVRWSLLLTGDAQFAQGTMKSKAVRYRPISISAQPQLDISAGTAQIVSGVLNSDSSVYFGGEAVGNFVNETTDQTAVQLPSYGISESFTLAKVLKSTILDWLGTQSSNQANPKFSVQVYAGSLLQSQSISEPSSGLAADSSIRGQLEWTDDVAISPSFMTVTQSAVNAVNSALFSFAVLLGVAGAGILAAAQSLIRVLVEQSSSSKGT